MGSMRLTIEVRGMEPSTIRSGETAWRMAIAAKVAERFPEPFTPPEGTEFAVDVVFHLVEHRLFVRPNRPGPPDLDNLLKPVLDTLFTSANVLGPTGVLVNANDTWVTDVRARKTEAPDSSQEGADITVSWPDGDASPMRSTSLQRWGVDACFRQRFVSCGTVWYLLDKRPPRTNVRPLGAAGRVHDDRGRRLAMAGVGWLVLAWAL